MNGLYYQHLQVFVWQKKWKLKILENIMYKFQITVPF